MLASEAVEVLAYVRAIWHLPAPAKSSDDLEAMLYIDKLGDERITPQDAKASVDRWGDLKDRFAPTVLQVRTLALAFAFARQANRALPAGQDHRPPCCREAPNGFAHWVAIHATPRDLQRLGRLGRGFAERYGISLEQSQEGSG